MLLKVRKANIKKIATLTKRKLNGSIESIIITATLNYEINIYHEFKEDFRKKIRSLLSEFERKI